MLAWAQQGDEVSLAYDYYQKKEYEKALDVFMVLYEKTQSRSYLEYVVQSQLNLKQYDEAEKFMRKQVKKYDDPSYSVMLGYVMMNKGDSTKATQLFRTTIDKLPAEQHLYTSLGSAFERYLYYEMARETYLRGQKNIGKHYSFHNELANVYFLTRNYKGMVDEYIALIEENEVFLDIVQERLQSLVVSDSEGTIKDLLKEKIFAILQKKPNTVSLSELLIWIFIQEKEFGAAFVQAKSLDTRNKESGERVFNLGESALANSDYNVAADCFRYIVDKGKDNAYYEDARSKLLTTLNRKIIENPLHTRQEEQMLEQMLGEAISQLGVTPKTVPMLIAQAHLQAFYLGKDTAAINLLESSLLVKNLPNANKSDIRMELGDIYLYTGDVWEANLVFAKVETDREGSPVAHEAKFRRARIAYFMGDFEWSRALLDILKAATSKLTSNDAFELSLLLSDNTLDDTVFTAMQIFARADYLSFKNQDSLALHTYDSIPSLYPGNSLEDDILFRKAKIYTRQKNYTEAALNLQQIVDRFAYEIYADDALFMLASLHEAAIPDKQKAMDLYKKLITDFSSSVFVVEARARYRALRGDGVN